jgi:hypothetical protein
MEKVLIKTDKNIKHQTVKLLKNKGYPTYQVYGIVDNTKIDPDDAFKMVILETMSWLRSRFREIDFPEELNFPDLEDYQNVSIEDFKSIHIREGYVLDISFVEISRIWALRLIEPDLGPEPGKKMQSRNPVPGRIFETNIGFIIHNGRVECGFKTICSEPIGTKDRAEVFRPAIVKSIVRNPNLGLRQELPILERPIILNNKKQIKAIDNFIKNPKRQMPIVIISETVPVVDMEAIYKEIFEQNRPFTNHKNIIPPDKITVETDLTPKIPFSADNIIKYKMGHAQFVILEYNRIDDYNKIIGEEYEISPGDTIIIYPLKLNKESTLFKKEYIISNDKKFQDELDIMIQNYPRGKTMDFGNVKFFTEARLCEHNRILDLSNSKEDVINGMEKKMGTILEVYESDLNSLKSEIDERDIIIEKYRNRIKDLEAELSQKNIYWGNRINELENNFEKEIEELNKKLQRKDILLDRPKKPEDIPNWAGKYFNDKLIFHPRAINEISKVNPREIDIDLLCDAIEFLATEYRDEVFGHITNEERNIICAEKYGRPFDVGGSGDKSIKAYPRDYKIKYGKGYTGKPKDVLLDMHLRVGISRENLIRIYFYIDRENELLVIGSLPYHLKTSSDKKG